LFYIQTRPRKGGNDVRGFVSTYAPAVIAGIALLFFGTKMLPDLGMGLGEVGLRGSKSAMSPGVKTVRNGEGEQQHIRKREGSMRSFSGKKF
jgi:Sec-independent protein translocase protein TatA